MSSKSNDSLVEFKPGDLVIQEKTAPSALFIVKEGQLEVYKTNGSGTRIPVGLINSGEYVGEAAMLLGVQHSSNVVALTKVKAIKINRETVEKQLEATPKWLVQLARGLVGRLHHSNELLRKHGIIDDKMANAIKAIEKNDQAQKLAV